MSNAPEKINQDSPTSNENSLNSIPSTEKMATNAPNSLKKTRFIGLTFTTFVFFILVSSILMVIGFTTRQTGPGPNQNKPLPAGLQLEKFKSEEEFQKYLEEGASLSESYGLFGRSDMMALEIPSQTGINIGPGASFGSAGIASPMLKTDEVYRVSETNVQVKGIDEPDILKTDGKNIFYSSEYYRNSSLPIPFIEGDLTRTNPFYQGPETKIIEAFPPQDLKKLSQISEAGDYLLYGNELIIFSGEKIIAYDITNASLPKESWRMDLKDGNSVVTSRLMGNFIYLVTSTRVSHFDPCIMPVFGGTREISVICTDIYRPSYPTYSDSTYTVFKVNPKNGNVEEKTSFIGSSYGSVTYMSPNAVYITYTVSHGILDIMTDFFTQEARDILPAAVVERVEKIKGYDISFEAKMIEIQRILEDYQNSLSDDERAKMENELQNKMEDYIEKRSRELVQSAVARVDINSFEASTSPLIPGTPLNQFSLDEYEGNLRIATTVGGGMFGSDTSANDVYILGSDLKVLGSVKDMGLTERIYSVRFIGDKGYVVTFRQNRPFYVLDLKDPKNPKLAGELKIPGYSGYLHPINKNKIIGVGMEGGNVKLSLFNVENPQNPLEVAKYDLDEYYSEAVNNHHAFLMDTENELFFMPGGKGGYVFSYSNDTFALKRVVSDMVAKRALYINDYLYIAGDDKLIVLELDGFEEVNRLTF